MTRVTSLAVGKLVLRLQPLVRFQCRLRPHCPAPLTAQRPRPAAAGMGAASAGAPARAQLLRWLRQRCG